MDSLDPDYDLENYDFNLPEDRIAQFPPKERGQSRLMVLKGADAPIHARFGDLAAFLPPRSLLVANNSRVVKARLIGARPGGGKAEFLLLSPVAALKKATGAAIVEGLIRPSGRIRPGDTLAFNDIKATIIAKGAFGHCQARLSWRGDIETALERAGRLPLPPYIRRAPEELDSSRYQTAYASKPGSVAAPTAGLHFKPELIQELIAAGHEWREISLHVGYGTFAPARERDIREHHMHEEMVEISAGTAAAIEKARAEKRPIIAIGTTSCRALEGASQLLDRPGPYEGPVNTYIYPGKKFQVINGLLTNFHLPRSTLLMLVAAFAGRERILHAYENAIANGYRFFSYGDATLLLPGRNGD